MTEIAAPVESLPLSCTDPILSSCANPSQSSAEVTTAITEFSSAPNAIGMGVLFAVAVNTFARTQSRVDGLHPSRCWPVAAADFGSCHRMGLTHEFAITVTNAKACSIAPTSD
jgi:hypothetical protein